ncbi:MAG TPA: putative C-S lyase [Tissierellia bacterium]|nr:putative C-S lyase [Tissierellia bacterium]
MINQRIKTYATKYMNRQEIFGTEDVIPLWIADMDLPGAPAITRALIERAEHNVWGYTAIPEAYYQAFIDWQQRRNGVRYDLSLMSYADNLVQAIQLTLGALLTPGDKVIVQPPVYHPFFKTVANNDLVQVNSALIEQDGYYRMDFDHLAKSVRDAKALILCNPHNPVGRNWSEAELTKLVDLCVASDVLILSDEIHSDLIHRGSFTPMQKLNQSHVITFNSTGKSFNTAGLQGGYVIFPNKDMKQAYEDYAASHGRIGANCFNIFSNIAAYNESEDWFDDTLKLIGDNIDYVTDRIHRQIPRIKLRAPEATYLMWLDFSDYGLSDKELLQRCAKAGVGLGPGEWFGQGGQQHMRLNAATEKELLEEALDRLVKEFA